MRRTAVALFAVLLAAVCSKNRPPDAPSLPDGPSVVPTDSIASFSSAATDPDGDSVGVSGTQYLIHLT
jgi:hypothetical protein